MMVFRGTVDATFTAFGINTTYTPAAGEPVGLVLSPAGAC
jgi:hypothetical protein